MKLKYKIKKQVRNGYKINVYIAICERCEQELKHVGSFAQKYCEECKPIVDREKSRERMRRYRARKQQNGG